jgi:hypothetical protein
MTKSFIAGHLQKVLPLLFRARHCHRQEKLHPEVRYKRSKTGKAKSNLDKPNLAKPNLAKPNHVKPNQAKPNLTYP